MLILQRKPGERIRIGDDVIVKLVEVRGDRAIIGIEAPRELPVHREEIYERIRRDGHHKG